LFKRILDEKAADADVYSMTRCEVGVTKVMSNVGVLRPRRTINMIQKKNVTLHLVYS
jgi:hypothetical protein